MSSTLSRTRFDVSTRLGNTEPLMSRPSRRVELQDEECPKKRPSFGKRALHAVTRFGITSCIGVAAVLGWQSYGDEARNIIANSSPALSWLAPEAARAEPRQPVSPPEASPEREQLNAISLNLAALRQSIDQLATGQDQMTQEIGTVRGVQQQLLEKISVPRQAATPTQKPMGAMAPPQTGVNRTAGERSRSGLTP